MCRSALIILKLTAWAFPTPDKVSAQLRSLPLFSLLHSDSCLGPSSGDAGSWGRGLGGLHPDLSSPKHVEERSFWKSSTVLHRSAGVSPVCTGMGVRTGGQTPRAGLVPCHVSWRQF